MNLIWNDWGPETLDIATSMLECQYIDLSISGTDGNNCLHLAATCAKPKLFVLCIWKVVELGLVKSEKLLYQRNTEGNDLMTLCIEGRSKTCVSSLLEMANFWVEWEHVKFAKANLGQRSIIYKLLKNSFE